MSSISFGKYQLLERLNIGAFAEVWRGVLTGGGFERTVAIKRVLPHLSGDHDFIKAFVEDGRLAAQLNHANIVQTYEVGEIDGAHYLAMEFISGKLLLDLVRHSRKQGELVPLPLACHLIAQCCDGLDHAHRKQPPIVHRDVAPANVFLGFDGAVKLGDWTSRAASRAMMTGPGILRVKISSLSPEQVKGHPLDGRSDLFQTGICLYELLTGIQPFAADNEVATIKRVLEAAPPPPRSHNPNLPEALEKVVLKSLQKEPAARFQHASELSAALRPFSAADGRDELIEYLKAAFPGPGADATPELIKQLNAKWGV